MLKDLINDYDEQIAHPSLGVSTDLGQKTYHALLDVIQNEKLHTNPEIVDQIKEIKLKADLLQKQESKLLRNFKQLMSLLSSMEKLYVLTIFLLENKKDPQKIIENLQLFLILKGICLIADELHENRRDLTLKACKAFTARCFLPSEIQSNEDVYNYLITRNQLAIIREIYPIKFKNNFEILLKELFYRPRVAREKEIYWPLVKNLIFYVSVLEEEEKEEYYSSIYKFLMQPNLLFKIFQWFFPTLNPQLKRKLLNEKAHQLVDNFLFGIEYGEIGIVQNCLSMISNSNFFDLIKNEPILIQIKPYLDIISNIHSQAYFEKGLTCIVQWCFTSRLNHFKQSMDPNNAILIEVLKIIENIEDLGFGLRLLHVLESIKNPMEAKIIVALSQKDVQLIEKNLKEIGLEPWEKLSTGDSVLELAAQLTIMDQKAAQEIKTEQYKPIKKKQAELFFFSLISFTKIRWELVQKKNPWQLVIEMIEQIAFRSNETFIFRNQKVFFGQWDDAAEFYDKIVKIFLPEEEHPLWIKYCADTKNQHPSINYYRRRWYHGSQESYGHWFQLTRQACHEAVVEKQGFNKILQLLAQCRLIAAFFMANIQQPRNGMFAYSTKIKIEHSLKFDAQQPLFFGIIRPYWTVFPDYFLLNHFVDYYKRIYKLITDFTITHSKAFMTQAFIKRIFYFKDRRFHLSKNHQELEV